jgi:ATP-dependent DNA helicase RecG
MLKNAESFFKRNTRVANKIIGFKRHNIPEYPFEAIREAIINAIAHRDYNFIESPITFFIYPDRIEVISPGSLIPPVEIKNLGETVAHRNTEICRLLEKTDFMEQIGTGIPRMKESMKNHGLKKPEFFEGKDFFEVTFRGPKDKILDLIQDNENVIDLKQEYGLNQRQIKAIELMNNKGKLFTIKEYMKFFSISRSTATRDLKNLTETNLISVNKSNNGNGLEYSINN